METQGPGLPLEYKVLAGWLGGYTSGDTWRRSTNIVSLTEITCSSTYETLGYVATSESGNTYELRFKFEGLAGLAARVYEGFLGAVEGTEYSLKQVNADEVFRACNGIPNPV